MESYLSFFDDQPYTFVAINDDNFESPDALEVLRKSWKARHVAKPQETAEDLAWIGYFRSAKKLMTALAETFGNRYRYLQINAHKLMVYGQHDYQIEFHRCDSKICVWEATPVNEVQNALLLHADVPYEALTAAAVLENSLRVPVINEEEKEKIKELLKVDRNDISTIETLVINRVGFSNDDITVLVYDRYDVSDIQDDKVPEIIQNLLIRQATWLGFARRKALLNNDEMFFLGESFNTETLAYNLDQILENENIEITIKSSRTLHVTGLNKVGQVEKIRVFSPRYIEGKWLWSVAKIM